MTMARHFYMYLFSNLTVSDQPPSLHLTKGKCRRIMCQMRWPFFSFHAEQQLLVTHLSVGSWRAFLHHFQNLSRSKSGAHVGWAGGF